MSTSQTSVVGEFELTPALDDALTLLGQVADNGGTGIVPEKKVSIGNIVVDF